MVYGDSFFQSTPPFLKNDPLFINLNQQVMTEQQTSKQQDAPQQPAQRPVVTQQIVSARFNTELTRINYQDALNRFNGLTVVRENIPNVREAIKKVRSFIRQLEAIKDEGKRPSIEEGRYWDKAFKDVLSPLQTSLQAKEQELQKIQDSIDEENKRIEQEKKRVDDIKGAINKFIIDTATVISQCTQPYELTLIEKTIGSHKANKTRYQEFLPELIERLNELTPIIKKQKELIKQLEKIEQQKKEADTTGDDRKLEQLDERHTDVLHEINKQKIDVQETAINQALRPDDNNTPQVVTEKVKWRRQSWKWEVKDINLLFKKMPQFVQLVANEEAIEEYLRNKKADGSLEGKDEEIINGLRLYLQKLA